MTAARVLQAIEQELTITQAAEHGTRRDLLVALRTRIAVALENPQMPVRELASLSLRLLEIAKEIAAIDAEGRDDDIGTAAATPDQEWAAS